VSLALSPTLTLNMKITKASLMKVCKLITLFHFLHSCSFLHSKWLLRNLSDVALPTFYDIPNNHSKVFSTSLMLHTHSICSNVPFRVVIISQIVENNVVYTLICSFLGVLGRSYVDDHKGFMGIINSIFGIFFTIVS
jgi:hypothetical protein